MLVIYTAYPTASGKPTAKDILPDIAPHEGEAVFCRVSEQIYRD